MLQIPIVISRVESESFVGKFTQQAVFLEAPEWGYRVGVQWGYSLYPHSVYLQ